MRKKLDVAKTEEEEKKPGRGGAGMKRSKNGDRGTVKGFSSASFVLFNGPFSSLHGLFKRSQNEYNTGLAQCSTIVPARSASFHCVERFTPNG
ncbi:hypothetical protein ElyMa_005456600 [Elysia marginata]|uniref:Uncharacterized protein n=1 Tax=Elysia marginata TaxID=1093978 RepID=A0AAV4EN58_9GAST|nr:hypothetical protein ElyMa_005456600 [Elysia marginata]